MPLRDSLLADLDACRWLTLRALADEAEERGDHALATGWRWLADNRYWPAGTGYESGPYCWTKAGRNDNRDEGVLRQIVFSNLKVSVALFAASHPDMKSAYAAQRERAWQEELQYREQYANRAEMARQDPDRWERDIRVFARVAHLEVHALYWCGEFRLYSFRSYDLPLLLEHTARVAGEWLLAQKKTKKKERRIDAPNAGAPDHEGGEICLSS